MCLPAPAPNAAAAPNFFPSQSPSSVRLPLVTASFGSFKDRLATPPRLAHYGFLHRPFQIAAKGDDDHGAMFCHPRSRSRLLPLKWCCWSISKLPVLTFPIGRPHLGSCFGHILARFQAKLPLYNGHVSHSPLLQPPCLSPCLSPLSQIPSPSLPSASTTNFSRTAVVPRYGPRPSRKYLFKVPFFFFLLAFDPHLSSPNQVSMTTAVPPMRHTPAPMVGTETATSSSSNTS